MSDEQVKPPEEFRCPQCRRLVFINYAIRGSADDPRGRWYHCFCGCLFNICSPDPLSVFTWAYRESIEKRKEIDDRYAHYVRCYAPLIEERTYGRRLLDVGYGVPTLMQLFEERGWIVSGIDIIREDHLRESKEVEGSKLVLPSGASLITANFETYEFAKGETFDVVWLGNVLECLKEPAAAIAKCFELLMPNGILFVAMPDSDLIKTGRFGSFGYWDMDVNRQILNERILRDLLGFAAPNPQAGRLKVIYSAYNFSQRFPYWNNLHLIAQKEAFDA